ncbi:hypothetical protein AB0C33_20635 [Nonomuraea sp. NPDC048881]|uniref:hypothetical protein n=1 Tax=Nonomuraea sp. NPDC048881 TaxID=3155030 RepID=UPI0033DD0953
MTEFVSVTKDWDRGITSNRGRYEFWTEDSATVYLQDTDFRNLTYQTGRPPVLEADCSKMPGPGPVIAR